MIEQERADDRIADENPTAEETVGDEPTEPESDPPSADELLEEALRDRDQFRALAMRYAADFENYRKRAAQDLANAADRANERLLLNLVNFADDFGRALDSPPQDAAPDGWDNWLEGVRIAMRGMESLLRNEGVSRIETAVGDPFDPNLHHALFSQPTDEAEEGAITAVIQNGYALRDRVLRAAQVGVAQPLPAAKQENDTQPEQTPATPQETN